LVPQAWAQVLKLILAVMLWIRNPEQFEISDERSAQEIALLFRIAVTNPFGKTGIEF
jgi:hypothetical protein